MLCKNLKLAIWILAILFELASLLLHVADAHSKTELRIEKIFIAKSPHVSILTMNGLLDGHNTYRHSYSIDVDRAFEPMRSIEMTNMGRTTVRAPRLSINNAYAIHDINSLADFIFADLNTARERALSLWLFFRDHRVHFRSPERGCKLTAPLRFLGNYGYITCGSLSNMLAEFAQRQGYASHTMRLRADNKSHSIAEIDFGDGFVILDPDVQVFYLDYDNQTLLGFQDVHHDLFLIRRTHHYGKNMQHDTDIGEFYKDGSRFAAGSCRSAALDINLRPGESFIFDWSPAQSFHHIVAPAPDSIPWMVANSRFDYRPALSRAPLSELFDSVDNIAVAEGTDVIHPKSIGKKSEFILAVHSPFVILDGKLNFRATRAGKEDTLRCDYSENGKTWLPLWSSDTTGAQKASISLSTLIAPMRTSAVNNYFIRFSLWADSHVSDCRIDSLALTTLCQTNKYNMPQLRLGENTLHYSDNNQERDLELVINWQETYDNTPPHQIKEPIFPGDAGASDNSQFTFLWREPVDPDGDLIVDYEFQLSDRPNMRFPLSPTFDRYISVMKDSLLPKFVIPYAGLLNHGVTYYWRVRAMDEHGAWSEWSNIWSFNANTVMMTQQPEILNMSETRLLTWKTHPNGKQPSSYQIHGSIRNSGFTPDSSTLLAETTQRFFDISTYDYSSFRVIAVDEDGYLSGPSRLAKSIPTDVKSLPKAPNDFALLQNAPNPFNATTSIHYSVPTRNFVTLKIYNMSGQYIETLVQTQQEPGSYTVMFDATHLSSGTYFYALEIAEQTQRRRMTLIR